MAWIYLLIAAVVEIAWTFSLRLMNVKKLRSIHWKGFFTQAGNWTVLAPFAGYIIFGLGNIYCMSIAMKEIPASTALAVWMGAALAGGELGEIIFLKGSYDFFQFFYMGLILAGIMGLRRHS